MKQLKHIPLQGAHNVRDLGGYPTKDGKMTRWGLLYRSDALAELTKEDWAALEVRKVRTIVDLRSRTEAAAAKITPPGEIGYFHFSLMNELDGGLEKLGSEQIIQSMKLDYERTLFGNLPCAAGVLNTILARMENGAVVFLCSAGKDRTGIIAALVLYLCGVAREDIVADYMVSSVYNTNGINKKLEALPEEYLSKLPDPELLKSCLASEPETITALLEALDRRGIRERLAEHGFSSQAQRSLAAKFTEEAF